MLYGTTFQKRYDINELIINDNLKNIFKNFPEYLDL